MEPVATSLGIISASATIVALANKANRALTIRRKRIEAEDWKAWALSHDGKVWMRDYLERLHRHDGGLAKSTTAGGD